MTKSKLLNCFEEERLVYSKDIYFAGGDFHELQELFSRMRGVVATKAGYINSLLATPSYAEVLQGKTNAAMGVKVIYNLKKLDISTMLDIFCTIINPYINMGNSKNGGRKCRSGIYYTEQEDELIIEFYMHFIKSKGKSSLKSFLTMKRDARMENGCCYMEALPLANFYSAEKEHQYYLRKNHISKTAIDFKRLQELSIISAD